MLTITTWRGFSFVLSFICPNRQPEINILVRFSPFSYVMYPKQLTNLFKRLLAAVFPP